MGNPFKKGEEKQYILELGADTDPAVCKKLGGKIGSDGRCRPVSAGMNKDGDVVLKNVSEDE
jgi:hypothetical protein